MRFLVKIHVNIRENNFQQILLIRLFEKLTNGLTKLQEQARF